MIGDLFARMRRGDRNALSRLLSHIARGEFLDDIRSLLIPSPQTPSARVIAFTGSGGMGKSTLIGRLIPLVRAANHRIAVLACDPQSPLSGGALLGDRFRMGSTSDDGVFIRSLAALSGSSGLAKHLDLMIDALEAFGFDVIFLETVGAGQGDVAVGQHADALVLLLQPESGDDVQWEKAGVLECADVIVIHKADLPTADQTMAQVRAALDLSPSRHIPVLRVSTKLNQGHAELWQTLESLPARRLRPSIAQRLLHHLIESQEQSLHKLETQANPELAKLLADWQAGTLTIAAAARCLGALLLTSYEPEA
ncbi:MAG: methylmalonyl Co-A mutase-associated GTPase MeaB [Gemmataceae bacterium]|nr:methylmalonyl Co-A mutase-associated GTPase MeaB [Gemmataceae bacterium]